MKRKITISLTYDEANALIDAGNRGIADLHDVQDDESSEIADVADRVLDRIGVAWVAAGWKETPESKP